MFYGSDSLVRALLDAAGPTERSQKLQLWSRVSKVCCGTVGVWAALFSGAGARKTEPGGSSECSRVQVRPLSWVTGKSPNQIEAVPDISAVPKKL